MWLKYRGRAKGGHWKIFSEVFPEDGAWVVRFRAGRKDVRLASCGGEKLSYGKALQSMAMLIKTVKEDGVSALSRGGAT